MGQCWARLLIDWVNAEWDFTPTCSTWSLCNILQFLEFAHILKISSSCFDLVDTNFSQPWQSWQGLSLHVNWVTAEWKKKLNKSKNSRIKSKIPKSYSLVWIGLVVQKTNKKFHAFLPNATAQQTCVIRSVLYIYVSKPFNCYVGYFPQWD